MSFPTTDGNTNIMNAINDTLGGLIGPRTWFEAQCTMTQSAFLQDEEDDWRYSSKSSSALKLEKGNKP